mgnify:CR=1 FL=1
MSTNTKAVTFEHKSSAAINGEAANTKAAALTAPALLHLLHLSSPALPIGAYAYSQGLEYAIDSGQLNNTHDIADWLTGVLSEGMANLDCPLLIRSYTAWQQQNYAAINHWNNYLRACRETSELLLEDEQLGIALSRLLNDLGLPVTAIQCLQEKPCFAVMFALAGSHWQIPLYDLLHSFTYSWLENQVAAATKIVPLGQTAAQKLLIQLLPVIPQAIAHAQQVADDELGLSLPGQVMASSLHEYQYSRLFRS